MIIWSCRELARALAEGELESAAPFSIFMARVHVWVCAGCRLYKKQLTAIAESVRRSAKDSFPADLTGLQARLKRKLAE